MGASGKAKAIGWLVLLGLAAASATFQIIQFDDTTHVAFQGLFLPTWVN